MPRDIDKRKPSTIIAELRRHLKDSHDSGMRSRNEASEFRSRAIMAEQEAAEWKRRFEQLLARIPLASLQAPKD